MANLVLLDLPRSIASTPDYQIENKGARVMRAIRLTCYLLLLSFISAPATAQQAEMSLEKAAQKSNNPVSDAWLLLSQNDLTLRKNPDGSSRWQNTLSLQPILPVPILGGDWNLVNRIITGVVTAPVGEDLPGSNGFDPDTFYKQRTTGNTDTIFFSLAAPNRDDGFIWGVGPTFVLPTASQDVLGQEKWQAGPAALVARLGNESGGLGLNNWNLGVLGQHWWDFAGDGDRESTNQSNIQYFINWRKDSTTLIGMTPNILIDWQKSGSDRFSVPVGLGTIGLFRWGRVPVRWGIEAQYFVMQSDQAAPEFNLKVFVSPIAPNPFKK